MSKHWSSQEIVRRVGWFARTWQTKVSIDSLTADRQVLNEALVDTSQAFKHDRTTTVTSIKAGDKRVVLKRYNARNLWHSFSRLLRRTRARRSWNMSFAFDRAGLNVAAPMLMYEHRFGPLRFDAYFASELLSGQELLSALPKMETAEQLQVVEAVKQAFETMDETKLTHGDMKATNLIWHQGKLFFIDLDAAQKHRNRVTWNASHAKDRKRFRKNWLGHPDLLALFAKL